mmetsp:Transcript_12186/g.20802  ORF Transcript_12186/g.20802 Transcript_12186/m.20802 type:complete len:273 (+) Transcript_12186:224-1042(+)
MSTQPPQPISPNSNSVIQAIVLARTTKSPSTNPHDDPVLLVIPNLDPLVVASTPPVSTPFLSSILPASLTTKSSTEEPETYYRYKATQVASSSRIGQYAKLTIMDGTHGAIHYEFRSGNGILYLIFTSKPYSQRTAFQVLRLVWKECESRYGAEMSVIPSSNLHSDTELFESVRGIMSKYLHGDPIHDLQTDVDEIKLVMQQNINAALANQENLEVLLDKSEGMKDRAAEFQHSSQDVKDMFWWKNIWLSLAILLAICVLVVVIVVPITVSK